jgi:hypothetical protein
MADPAAEETVPAPPPTPAVDPAEGASDAPQPVELPADTAAASPEKVSSPPPEPAPAVRSRGFRLLGEDTSVHKALGGGKSKEISTPPLLFFFFFFSFPLFSPVYLFSFWEVFFFFLILFIISLLVFLISFIVCWIDWQRKKKFLCNKVISVRFPQQEEFTCFV